jgi:hypothetical protein
LTSRSSCLKTIESSEISAAKLWDQQNSSQGSLRDRCKSPFSTLEVLQILTSPGRLVLRTKVIYGPQKSNIVREMLNEDMDNNFEKNEGDIQGQEVRSAVIYAKLGERDRHWGEKHGTITFLAVGLILKPTAKGHFTSIGAFEPNLFGKYLVSYPLSSK